jgi:hypothetical protein
MRLLHTRDLTFQEFFDEWRPPYAILSHRWTEQEVSHKQYIEKSYTEGPGIQKIRKACAQALHHSLDWLWVDTICIDKSSSAELTEAINSMWNWYLNATICIAYLADVGRHGRNENTLEDFPGSEWFLRGWTLQELLAPRRLVFFDAKWRFVEAPGASTLTGSREQLARQISRATGIDEDFLTRKRELSEASVAMRMSWASKRKTTRVEDEAYCLLGLFGVNMPLLYGEGKNAFFRLQLEILRTSDDESIFAWRANNELRGLIAESAREFASAGNIYKMELGPEQRLPWAWTNKGLELRILDRATKNNFDPMPPGNAEQPIYLGCYIEGPSSNPNDMKSPSLQAGEAKGGPCDSYIAISIKRFGNAWYRMRCHGFYLDTGFQSMARFTKTPLVYKYYYVPRHPSREAWDAFEEISEQNRDQR